MSNELYEHKRSDTVKWILTLLAFILVGVMLAGIILGWFDKKEDVPAEDEQTEQAAVVDGDGNAMDEDIVYPMPAKMSFSALALAEARAGEPTSSTVAASEQSVEVEIEAYVMPENATNREVDFSIAWGEGAQRSAEPVTNYVTVTPKADGSNVATVTAYKGFENASILITVTTRVGGFTAECKVLYEGIPERLDFVFGGEAYKSTSEVELSAGETYEIGLKPTNALGDVGSKYNDFEITQIQMKGRFNATREYVVNGSVQKSDTIVIDLSSPTFAIYDIYGELSGDTRTILPSEFMDVTLSGNTLTVVCKKTESAYLSDSGRTGTRVSYAGVYEDPRNGGLPDDCYLEVYVREKTSGESCLIQLDMVSSVTGVELPESTITI